MPNKYPPIVANKFDPKLFSHRVTCPYCNSKQIRYLHSKSTLMAYSGKVDINHVWNYYTCGKCQKPFSYETKSGEAWYVAEDGEVLKGLPNCFEEYVLKCAYCGGKVHRKYLSFKGEPVYGISPGCQVEWYICEGCGKQETLDNLEPEQDTSTSDVKIVYGDLTPKLSGTVTVLDGYKAEKLSE